MIVPPAAILPQIVMKFRLIVAAAALACVALSAWAENIQYGPPAAGGGSAPCNAFGSSAGTCVQGGTALTNVPSLTMQTSGAITAASGPVFVNSTLRISTGIALTTVVNASCTANQEWMCARGVIVGTINGGTAYNQFTMLDRVANSSTTTSTVGWLFEDNVADSGFSASGSRNAMLVRLTLSDLSNGVITNPGNNSALVAVVGINANLGGTATGYAGIGNSFNPNCIVAANATFIEACGVSEDDIQNNSASLNSWTGHAIVELAGSTQEPRLGPGLGLVFAEGNVTIGPLGMSRGIIFSSQNSGSFPIAKYGIAIYSAANVNTQSPEMGAALDSAVVTMHTCEHKGPFVYDCALQAAAITGATRLTTDGAAASGFIYSTLVTAKGTGYTQYPTVTVTGCTATLNPDIGTGGVIPFVGIFTTATNCPSNTTAAITGGDGTGSPAVALTIAGNTLNFPINDAISASCEVVGHSAAGDAIGWTLRFGAAQGATPGTTSIVGSPTWQQVFATTGAAAKISLSAPTADTTLGAVNITVTPSSSTWNIGGNCHVTHTSQA